MISEIRELVGREYLLTTEQSVEKYVSLTKQNKEADLFSNNTVAEIDARLVNNTVTILQHGNG